MYERMLDKNKEPSPEQIREYIGEAGYERLCGLEAVLAEQYDFSKELRFPFGNNYGWGYKYSHKSFHLCYAFFEKGAFLVMTQVGDSQVPALEKNLDHLSEKAKELWVNRYPCGDQGGWVKCRILEEADLSDALTFIHAKKAPPSGKRNKPDRNTAAE